MAAYPYKVLRQFCVPQHALSQFGGMLSRSEIPWLKNYLIRYFLKRYNVNLEEAKESDPFAYPSYHAFFTRELKEGMRTIDNNANSACSPCDGTISQFGNINEGQLIQAKGHQYSVQSLLGSQEDAKPFLNGRFMTIYLAPIDYHRVHTPLDGRVEKLRYIPGKLFSVNPLTTSHIPNLFARNERLVVLLNNPKSPFAVVLVGAMIVGNIYTRICPKLMMRGNKILDVGSSSHLDIQELDKGQEIGYFSLGSTVIVLLAENFCWEYDLQEGSRLVVGQRIGHFLP